MFQQIESNPQNCKVFNHSLSLAKSSSDGGKYLVERGADIYIGKILYGIYNPEKTILVAGAAIIDGEIASIFKNFELVKKLNMNIKVLRTLMPILISGGGTHLVCQEEHLKIYRTFGFEPVARCKPTDNEPEKYYLCTSETATGKILKTNTYEDAKTFQKLLANNKVEVSNQ